MKALSYLFVLVLLSTLIACNNVEEARVELTFSFQITGVKESMNAEFVQYNGRIMESPVGRINLLIHSVESNETVYTRSYSPLPQNFQMPALPGGTYKVYLNTVGDETMGVDIIIVQFNANERNSDWPLYAGYVEFLLDQDGQQVNINMANVSTKVIAKIMDEQSVPVGHRLDVEIGYSGRSSYDIETKTFTYDECCPQKTYANLTSDFDLYELYHLPIEIVTITLKLYNSDMVLLITRTINIDPGIDLQVGDQITFSIDVDNLISQIGTNSTETTLNWESITWNPLPEIIVP